MTDAPQEPATDAAGGGRRQPLRLSCVIPVYNEAAGLQRFLRALAEQLRSITPDFELVLVNDGSQDATEDIALSMTSELPLRYVALSRNFGKEAALSAGINYARGNAVVLIDADFQHPLRMLPQMHELWRAGYDMIYGVIADRSGQSGIKRLGTRLFDIVYYKNTIQPNDILSIDISAAMPETALPYNKQFGGGAINNTNIDVLKLRGYLVDSEGTVSIPVLGKVLVKGKTTMAIEDEIAQKLESGNHLVDPVVSVRLLNSKVTILGEVNGPGTFSFTEESLSVPQALGYAGDLTINGKRDEIMLIREVDGKRTISQVDLTTADWMSDPEYIIKPNDVLVVMPNRAKVKSAGYVGTATTVMAITSTLISIAILIFR